FCAEKRLENVLPCHGINAGSRIGDRKHGVSARLQFCFSETDFVARDKRGSSNGQLTSIGHGIARIDDEILQDLPDLAAVRADWTEICPKLETHVHLCANQLEEHFFHFLEDDIQI